jgi:hypothetical protein
MRRALAALFTTLLVGGLLPASASAETDNRDVLNFKGVDTYFSVTWQRGSGNCRNAWKIQNAQYRFHRDKSARFVRVREFRMAQQYSSNCSGSAEMRKLSDSHDACFGCNGNGPNWSRLYSYSPGWPYMLPADFAFQQVMLKVAIRQPMSSSVVTLGRFCRSSQRFGGSPCP